MSTCLPSVGTQVWGYPVWSMIPCFSLNVMSLSFVISHVECFFTMSSSVLSFWIWPSLYDQLLKISCTSLQVIFRVSAIHVVVATVCPQDKVSLGSFYFIVFPDSQCKTTPNLQSIYRLSFSLSHWRSHRFPYYLPKPFILSPVTH